MTTTVTTQAELDAALASDEYDIIINSPRGVWIDVPTSGSATVRASGSATVSAYDSATVSAYDSATVRAYGSATVRAYGSATVRASGSATVSASGSATVSAYDSATVRAYGSATVRASGSATVSAGKYVPVHLHSKRVTLDGGIPIDVSDVDLTDRQSWLDFHGVTVTDGKATVYKAVDADLNAGHTYKITAYPIGETVTAPDWKPSNYCGNGLHFGYAPHIAASYFNGGGEPRFLECVIDVDTFVALGDKCKAESVTVIREVTIDGKAVSA